jgi:hypothetical protein
MSEEVFESTISVHALITIIHGAALEINSGIQMSRHGNCIKAARIQGLIPKTGRYTKKQVLQIAVEVAKQGIPDYKVASNVQKALDK